MKKKSKLKTALIILCGIVLALVLIIVPCDKATTVSDGLSLSSHFGSAPAMVAHRGFSSLYPENTLPAFEGAAEAGFDGYELDLHTTKDGEWVVIHDDTVDKMTDGTGEVDSFTLEEIRSFKIDGGKGIENYPDLKLPTLEEAFAVCDRYDIFPVIEIKKCDVQYLPELKEHLDEKGLSERAVIISFTEEYLTAYRELDSDIQMYWLTTDFTKEDVDWCKENGFGINFHNLLLYKYADAVLYAKKQGVKLAAWTVDNTVFKDVMVLFGADVITTNKITPLGRPFARKLWFLSALFR